MKNSDNKLKNLDSAGMQILAKSKEELTETARNLKSSHEPLTEYEMLYKLSFLIKTRLEMIKDSAQENFLERFGGSKTERENGFVITLKEMQEYKYSDSVKDLESEIELLKEQLKQQKEKEKKSGKAITGNVISENLTLTLK